MKYPENEQAFFEQHSNLINEWKNHISDKNIIENNDADGFVYDGFYPYYYSQKYKILYIAAEARGKEGFDYIEELYKAYKDNKVDGRHINSNSNRTHGLMFCITHGIKHNFKEWSKIPYASEMTCDFGTKNGISFAFMELSKFVNKNKDFKKDFGLINKFIEISKNEQRNYWNDQIKILDPNIIITMNFKEHYLKVLGNLETIDKSYPSVYNLEVGNKKIKLIDTYHFAYRSADPKVDFYDPIIKILKNNNI